jgi:hypothetical protein
MAGGGEISRVGAARSERGTALLSTPGRCTSREKSRRNATRDVRGFWRHCKWLGCLAKSVIDRMQTRDSRSRRRDALH